MNGQSPSLAWPLWYPSHLWLFFWPAELFGDWNARGSTKHVYFREQVFFWLWVLQCCQRNAHLNMSKYITLRASVLLFYFRSNFSGPSLWPGAIQDVLPMLPEHCQTKPRGLSQDYKEKNQKKKIKTKHENIILEKKQKSFKRFCFQMCECCWSKDRRAISDASFHNLVLFCLLRRDPSQEQESKMFPDVQEINEPIYINMEVWLCFILWKHIQHTVTLKRQADHE